MLGEPQSSSFSAVDVPTGDDVLVKQQQPQRHNKGVIGQHEDTEEAHSSSACDRSKVSSISLFSSDPPLEWAVASATTAAAADGVVVETKGVSVSDEPAGATVSEEATATIPKARQQVGVKQSTRQKPSHKVHSPHIAYVLVRFASLFGVYYVPPHVRGTVGVGELALCEGVNGINAGVIVQDLTSHMSGSHFEELDLPLQASKSVPRGDEREAVSEIPVTPLYSVDIESGLAMDRCMQRLPRIVSRAVNKDRKRVFYSRRRDTETLPAAQLIINKCHKGMLLLRSVEYQIDFRRLTLHVHGGGMGHSWPDTIFSNLAKQMMGPLRTHVVEFRFSSDMPEELHLTRFRLSKSFTDLCFSLLKQSDAGAGAPVALEPATTDGGEGHRADTVSSQAHSPRSMGSSASSRARTQMEVRRHPPPPLTISQLGAVPSPPMTLMTGSPILFSGPSSGRVVPDHTGAVAYRSPPSGTPLYTLPSPPTPHRVQPPATAVYVYPSPDLPLPHGAPPPAVAQGQALQPSAGMVAPAPVMWPHLHVGMPPAAPPPPQPAPPQATYYVISTPPPPPASPPQLYAYPQANTNTLYVQVTAQQQQSPTQHQQHGIRQHGYASLPPAQIYGFAQHQPGSV